MQSSSRDSASQARTADPGTRPLLPLAALLAGLALSATVGLWVRHRELAAGRADLARDADRVTRAVRATLEAPVEAVQTIPAFYQSVDHPVAREHFEAFVRGALARNGVSYAFEWVPIVPREELEGFLTKARNEVSPDFALREFGEAGMRPAGPRPVYRPILFMVPPHPEAVGLDVSSYSVPSESLDRAERTRRLAVSAPFRLVEDAAHLRSIALVTPVVGRGGGRVAGFAIEIVRVNAVVDAALARAAVGKLEIAAFDTAVDGAEGLLHETQPGLLGQLRGGGRGVTRLELAVGDRTWAFVFRAGPGAYGGEMERAWAAAGIGVLLSALLALALAGRSAVGLLRRQITRAKRLGQYELDEKIGEGGMGVVYRARHALLRRPTAVKLLRGSKGHPDQLVRFEREVRLTAKLTHPNTILVYDFGRTPDGRFYYAMEFVDGITLDELVSMDGPQPAARVCAILEQVCGALAEAHEGGLIHRDIKPANVMLCERGGTLDFVKVLDFGLAKDLDAPRSLQSSSSGGTLTGTPLFLSPESVQRPETVDARSDLYALGAVAYHLLTAEHVFEADTVVELCALHAHRAPEPPSERLGRTVPAALEALVLRCLAKAQDDRPPSARALRDELERIRGLEETGTWTQEDAAEWWKARRDELAKRTHVKPERRTLRVDVDARHLRAD